MRQSGATHAKVACGRKVRITRVYRQRLIDITPEEAFKERGYTVEEFKNEEFWVYEFKVVDPPTSLGRFNEFLSGLF